MFADPIGYEPWILVIGRIDLMPNPFADMASKGNQAAGTDEGIGILKLSAMLFGES